MAVFNLGNPDAVHNYNADTDNFVLQANTNKLHTQHLINENNYTLRHYKGAFFTSSVLNKSELESDLRIKLR